MSHSGIMVFESAVDLKMYKVGDDRSPLVIDPTKPTEFTILQPDSSVIPAEQHPQWDIIKERLIPI